jgi:hypothetical protein
MRSPETPDPHCGRVLLFTGGDPIASIVKWQSRSHYSHAALLIPGANRVIESYPFHGVRQRALTVRDWERVHAYEVPSMTPQMWDAAVAFCESQHGKPYDWRSVLKFVTRTPARENGKWFCSELVFKALEVSYLRPLQMKAEYVNPGHLPASPYLHRDEQFELKMLEALTNDD